MILPSPVAGNDSHWLDLRGRDLVRAAVNYALHPGSGTQSRIQLPPQLITVGTMEHEPAVSLLEYSS